jgi:hypothetical protein
MKKGDKVKCINIDLTQLNPKKIYTVVDVDRHWIKINDVYNWYKKARFEKIRLEVVK